MTSDETQYALQAIKVWIWSGFYGREEVAEMLEDIVEEGTDVSAVEAAVAQEFAAKAKAEESWPAETDCDRLDRVFAALNASGIIAIQNAGYTQSDGYSDVMEIYEQASDEDRPVGYCYYHGQDLENGIAGEGVFLSSGPIDAAQEETEGPRLGRIIVAALEKEGFATKWDGTFSQRILIENIEWKRRLAD
jgi:hypothetical protein